jgi:NAD(P)H-hydrate epimerase
MRRADKRAIEELSIASLVLMENASRGACDLLASLLGTLEAKRVAVLCGKGNNGGDGLALARHALIAGADVTCILIGGRNELSADARAQYEILAAHAPERLASWESFAKDDVDWDAIVDGLLGTGSSGELRHPIDDAVAWCNEARGVKLALDIPTGIDADTGAAPGHMFRADATATMAALKPGLLLGAGAESSGDLYVVSIGAPAELYHDSELELLDAECASRGIPRVASDRNKYDRGKVLVAAGSRGMTGAAVMAAEGALHAGAGLTLLALPEAASLAMPQSLAPEVMTLLLPDDDAGAFAANAFDEIIASQERYASIAVGPGLSRSESAARAVRTLLAGATIPLVLDADGLNAYAGDAAALARRDCPLVITPHHGELGRLLGIDRQEITRDPLGHARAAAATCNCVVVLKGAPTVVAEPGGRAWINSAGNPGMATGGTGDVLTGTIAALLAQPVDHLEATLAAVYLHSLAGDLAVEERSIHSLVATDIIAHLADAYRSLAGEA